MIYSTRMENAPESLSNILENKEILDFIKSRNFKDEDLPSIVELAKLDKEMLNSNFHNSFQFWQGRTEKELMLLKLRLQKENNSNDEELLKAVDIYLILIKKYDDYAVDHLNRILESIK